MSLVKWDPFNELEDMSNRLNRIFQRRPTAAGNAMAMTDWVPTVDVEENEEGYLVKAELPGMKKEDIKVTVDNGMLSFRGERKFEKEEKGKKYHRVERSYGTFFRSFSLPEGVDEQKLHAEFKDGLLSVFVPKAPNMKPKAVQVPVK